MTFDDYKDGWCDGHDAALEEQPHNLVLEFHEKFGEAIEVEPTVELCELRHKLIAEEAAEVVAELELLQEQAAGYEEDGSRVRLAKELADLVYVAYGTAITFGIDLDRAVREVHRSNMTKLQADGTVLRREDGKVLKGPDYRPADVSAAVHDLEAS